MDCKKVQDRFSSLWEKELTPSEEKIVRAHLSSCPECQKEFKQFEKTLHWLHSVGEVEVPDGFLTELQQKMEGRKSKTIPAEEAGGRWLNLPSSFKLPIQAVAMVAIVFLVLYLTKMVPPPSPLSVDKKSDQILAQRELKREQRPTEILSEVPRPKDVGQGKVPVTGKEKIEVESHPQTKAESDQLEVPPPKVEKELVAKKRSVEVSKFPKEIVLRVSDREKVISRLHEMIKQFEGEMVTVERNIFLASIPIGSFSEFEKEMVRLSHATPKDKMFAKRPVAESLKAAPGGKREETEVKSKEPTRYEAAEEGHIAIRILLIEE